MAKVAFFGPIRRAVLFSAGALLACTVSKEHDESAFKSDVASSESNADGLCSGKDCCPDDPLKSAPGICGCGTPDEDTSDAASCTPVRDALAHRYSFSGFGPSVDDSVGHAAGDIFGTELPKSNPDGTLILAGGSNEQYFDLPNGIVSALTDATIEVWLTWAGGDPWQRIFDFGTSGTEGVPGTGASYLFLTPRSATDPPKMRVAFSAQGRDGEAVVDAPPLVPDAETHITVVVSDTADTISTYVNGALEATGHFEGHLTDLTDVNNWIGRSQFAPDPGLAATLTEVRIYRTALTARQVALTHRFGPDPAFLSPTPDPGGTDIDGDTAGAGHSGDGGSLNGSGTGGSSGSAQPSRGGGSATRDTPASPASAALSQGLVLYYDFDETSGSTVHDRRNAANNGILHGAATWIRAGKIGGALTLAGGPGNTPDPQYVEVPPAILRPLQQTTIAAWVRWNGGPLWQRVFDFGTDTENSFFFTPFADLSLAALKTTAPGGRLVFVESRPPLPVSEWTHVAVTWSASTIGIYVNGQSSATSNPALPPGVAPSSLGMTPRDFLGRSQVAEDPLFAGSIDEFRIYDRVLSPGEITALHDLDR